MAAFTVMVSTLHAGAGALAGDAAGLGAATATSTGALSAAAGGVPGGALVAALGDLAAETGERLDAMAEAVDGASTTLVANAQRYADDDASAATALGRAVLL